MKLTFSKQQQRPRLEKRHRMLKALQTAMQLSGLNDTAIQNQCPQARLHVIVVDRHAIETLNREFLGHEGPTDVISFSLCDPNTPQDTPQEVFGEIYVCLDVAAQAAVQCGTSVDYEVLLYAVHGMLHLTGLDDRGPQQRKAMDKRQREIMDALQEKVKIEGIFRQREE